MRIVASIPDSKGLVQDCVWSVESVVPATDNTRPVQTWSSVCGASILSPQVCRVSFSSPHIFLCTPENQPGPHLAGLKNIYGQNGQSEVFFFFFKEVVGRQVKKRRGSRRRRKPCKLQNTLHLWSNETNSLLGI